VIQRHFQLRDVSEQSTDKVNIDRAKRAGFFFYLPRGSEEKP